MKILWMAMMVFCGGLLMAGTEVDINGTFKGSTVDAKNPKGWSFNTGVSKHGTGKVVQIGDKFGVQISNEQRELQYFTNSMTPVTAGDKFELSCTAEGTGKACLAVYYYDAKKYWVAAVYQPLAALKPGKNELKWEVTVPAELRKKTPANVRFAFRVYGKAEMTFSDYKVVKADNK